MSSSPPPLSWSSELETMEVYRLKESLENGFGELVDPRRRPYRCDHPLLTVIGIAVLAVIAGGKGWEDALTLLPNPYHPILWHSRLAPSPFCNRDPSFQPSIVPPR